jgi:hypothetical protein
MVYMRVLPEAGFTPGNAAAVVMAFLQRYTPPELPR